MFLEFYWGFDRIPTINTLFVPSLASLFRCNVRLGHLSEIANIPKRGGSAPFWASGVHPTALRWGLSPKSSMKPVEELIRRYIAQNVLFSKNGYPYADDTPFLETGILDSTNVLELVMFAEEQFGINIDDRDVVPDNFDSVTKLASYVRRSMAGAPA